MGDTARLKAWKEGLKTGIPIGLGYFAVSFSLGIAMRNAGMNAFQGFLLSLLDMASAGEYAATTVIAADAAYMEMLVITIVTNARYLLMSFSLSQKYDPATPLIHRLMTGYFVTDEIYAAANSREGYLEPSFIYGQAAVCWPAWSAGTALGVIAGNILPQLLVNALAVSLYGMFLAVIIPPARKDIKIGLLVLFSFAASWAAHRLFPAVSEGSMTIILTLLIGFGAAVVLPQEDEDEA